MNAKKEKQVLENLPGEAAEFIRLIIRKMRYRRSVRREVMAELAGHFEDCLEDIKDAAEREKKVREIIEGFGDAKVLGVLLRRAKKRCRPMWRTVTLWTVRAVFLLLILDIGLFVLSKPVPAIDYFAELNRMARPVADDSMNAAPFYRKAAEMVGELPEEIDEIFAKRYRELSEEDKGKLSDYLEENCEFVELLKQGAEKPYYWAHYEAENPDDGLIATLNPNLSEYRMIATRLGYRSRMRAWKGNYEGAIDDIAVCFKFSYHLKQPQTLIEQLVGIAIQALAVGTLEDIVYESDIGGELLGKIQRQIEDVYLQDDFEINYKSERLYTYDEIQRCFSGDGIGGGRLCLKGIKRLNDFGYDANPETVIEEIVNEMEGLGRYFMLHYVFISHPDKSKTIKDADRVYDYYEQYGNKSPYELHSEGVDIDDFMLNVIEDNYLLSRLTPAFEKINAVNYRVKVGCGAAVTILGVLRYKDANGQYPESLDKLVDAGFLKEVPDDPWSDVPLIYRRDGDDFILYSIGKNFVDDGGVVGMGNNGKPRQWAENGDFVFWPVFQGE